MRTLFPLLVAVHLVAALAPFQTSKQIRIGEDHFPGWPKWLIQEQAEQVPLLEEEQRWVKGFPGKVSRFRGEDKEYLIRWVTRPTRALHPVSDCLRGGGYQVAPAPLRRDSDGSLWGCVTGSEKIRVCERIMDESGNSWSDVSSWYWAALLGRTTGPWWAIAESERIG